MKIDWTKYFDKIVCVHYLPYKERYETLCKELDYVDILNSPIFEWKYVLNNEKILNIGQKSSFNQMHKNVNSISNTLSEFDIWNLSAFYDYKHTLIIEDDVLFRKNKEQIFEVLENLPDDYDICLFDYVFNKNLNIIKYNELDNQINGINTNYYGIYTKGFLTSCYSISNKYAKYIVNYFPYYDNSILHAADGYMSPNENLPIEVYKNNFNYFYKSIYSKYQLTIQQGFKSSNNYSEFNNLYVYNSDWVEKNPKLNIKDFYEVF